MKKREVLLIPASIDDAEEFLKSLGPGHVGRRIEDSVERKLKLDVQKTVASYRVRVKVAGRWTPFTIGRVGEVPFSEARSQVATLREQKYSFDAREQLEKAVGRKSLGECPSILECFEFGVGEGNALKNKSIDRYRFALTATGADFYNVSIALIGPSELKAKAKAFRKKYSHPYFRNFLAALDIAYEWAIDNSERTGVERNLSSELKGIDYDVTDRETKRKNLEWNELRALWGWLSDPRCPLPRTQIRLYKTMLLVGERIDSLCNAEWADIGEDGWWIIPPSRRKMALVAKSSTPPVYIRMTEVLRNAIGWPDGSSRYIFPSGTDPGRPYSHGSQLLWDLFRVREAVKAGVTIESLGPKITFPAPLSGSMKRSTAKRERNILRRLGRFLIPDEVPSVCHHEAGRHTVPTLAQEEGIPGIYVSHMLGHTNEKTIQNTPILHHSTFSRLAKEPPPAMPRALLRQAAALASTGKTAKEHYTHIKGMLRGIEAAWIFWTAAFARKAIGEVPQSITDAMNGLLGADDKVLALLKSRFSGDLLSALQHVRAGLYQPAPEERIRK